MSIICLISVGIAVGCAPEMGEEKPFDAAELRDLNAKLSFSLVNWGSEPRLQVQFSFVSPRERLYLRLPETFLREDKLFDRIESLQASGGTLQSYYRGGENLPSIKVLTCEPSARVTIRYFVRNNDAEEARDDPESFQSAVIEPDYVRFVGAMALILPDALRTSRDFLMSIEWNVPTDFAIFDSYGAGKRVQRISTNAMNLKDALFLAGKDLEVMEKYVGQNPINIVFRGKWDQITYNAFVDVLTRLIKTQRETWRDNNFPYFLISLRSVPGECRERVKFAGTAHLNSFRAYLPKGCRMRPEVIHLFSHELMHMWIGKKILHGEKNGHIDGKWFTEGFTDYYGRIMAYRAGLLSEDQLFQTLNEDLIKYYMSRYRRITLNELVKRMYKKDYTSQSLEKIPYQQGEIIAWRLNKLIKERSSFTKSLDDVIRVMLKIADENGGVKNFSLGEMEAIFNEFYPDSLQHEFEKIKEGAPIAPPQLDGCANKRAEKTLNFKTAMGVRRVEFPETGYIYLRPQAAQCHKWLY